MHPNGALLRVVPPGQLDQAINTQDREKAQAEDAAIKASQAIETPQGLAGHIRTQFDMMQRHRNTTSGWSHRLLSALRVFNGEYDPEKLAQIKQFGGSEIYARLVAMKCRGASSLLRDVYLSPDRPWGLAPPDDPDVPEDIINSIRQLVQSELTTFSQEGQQIDLVQIRERTMQLMEAARKAAKKKASQQARVAEDKIDEILKNGGFYKALAEFLVDLPLFPFACLKGPVVRIVPTVVWVKGKAQPQQKPRLFWERKSPFDIWWTPGVADIENAEVIERSRITRAELNDLLDLPGYNTDAIRAVLDEYGSGGLSDNWDSTDAERADQESRENPLLNRSGLISCLEYHGNVQGRMLLEWGMEKEKVPDELRDYFVQAWLIGRHVIKVQLSPSPRKRHPYFITSFEKVPGTPVGNALPDILADIADAGNATLRALINNMSIASGPQVVVNTDRTAPGADVDSLFPWKRWHVAQNPMPGSNGSEKPVDFFQPQSNAQELLAVYNSFVTMADELSAIPRYMSGSNPGGGAGRTASGLAMLMGNASKILQTVAANVDRDVIEPLLLMLFDMLMLTDTSGLLTGQEQVRVLGVSVAVQKETQRARQLEFLTATANPVDMQIIGPKGRAEVLRSVAGTIGMDGAAIVPTADEMEQMQRQAAQAAQGQGMPGHGGMGEQAADAQGGQQGPPGDGNQGPVTAIAGGPQ